MTTECNSAYLDFPMVGPRQVLADFDGGDISSDGGALLLRETERLTGIVRQFAACFTDHRNPDLTEHTVEELIAQRVYALALGYEDLNDHDDLRRIVAQVRQAWPGVKIVIRGDSGFCREPIMSWCEGEGVDYVLGLAQNTRLKAMIATEQERARVESERTKEAARVFTDLQYRTLDSWSRERRVVAKAEHLAKGANPRFVVTSLTSKDRAAKPLYEEDYCGRGEMENRIKEQQLHLFADRTSASTMRANQVRLFCSSIAYVLMEAMRRLGLAGPEAGWVQCQAR